MNPKAVAFSGHRTFKAAAAPDLFAPEPGDPAAVLSALKPRLAQALGELYDQGYRTFLCGMAEGFDMLAAEAVLELDAARGGALLTAAIPYPGHHVGFVGDEAARYRRIIDLAHTSVVVSGRRTPDCYHRRNDYLVDNSDVLVCFYNGAGGGTAYTVRRARRSGHRVINLDPACGHCF